MNKKNYLIIGGASGVGLCLVKLLKSNGHTNITVWDRKKLHFKKIISNIVDVSKENSVKKEISKIIKSKKKYDSVILCHAVHHTMPLLNTDVDKFKKIFEINFFSNFYIIKNCLEIINQSCKLITLSSIAASTPIPYSSSYSASKAALEAMLFSLKNEKNDKNFFPIIVQIGNINTGFNETGNEYKDKESKNYSAYRKIVKKINSKNGIDPNNVAKILYQISNSKNPKLKYIVGKNAFMANLANRIFGNNIACKLINLYFKY